MLNPANAAGRDFPALTTFGKSLNLCWQDMPQVAASKDVTPDTEGSFFTPETDPCLLQVAVESGGLMERLVRRGGVLVPRPLLLRAPLEEKRPVNL